MTGAYDVYRSRAISPLWSDFPSSAPAISP
jgi:hypothetical protein